MSFETTTSKEGSNNKPRGAMARKTDPTNSVIKNK